MIIFLNKGEMRMQKTIVDWMIKIQWSDETKMRILWAEAPDDVVQAMSDWFKSLEHERNVIES